MNRWLCFFGLHDWTQNPNQLEKNEWFEIATPIFFQQCCNCGKKRYARLS